MCEELRHINTVSTYEQVAIETGVEQYHSREIVD